MSIPDFDHPDSVSTSDLAFACAQRRSRASTPGPSPDPCYVLFCRAFGVPPDQEAWQAITRQYSRLVSHWLGQHANDDTLQETFVRLWKSQQQIESAFSSRFHTTAAIVGYLKQCAIAVRIHAGRAERRAAALYEKLQADTVPQQVEGQPWGWQQAERDLQQLLRAKLKNEQEGAVFELSYCFDLAPREVQAERPDLFPDAQAVYRIKENLLKRLRRDPELAKWWSGLKPI
jgi:DNA-directed RNA polymerase specialized sigma24 family protein